MKTIAASRRFRLVSPVVAAAVVAAAAAVACDSGPADRLEPVLPVAAEAVVHDAPAVSHTPPTAHRKARPTGTVAPSDVRTAPTPKEVPAPNDAVVPAGPPEVPAPTEPAEPAETPAEEPAVEVPAEATHDPAPDEPPPAEPVDPEFGVHEWGTFTSVQSSEGVTLEGLHHEEEELPSFVHALCGALSGWCPKEKESNQKGVGADQVLVPEPVTQKLETPVLYFHSDVPRKVLVDVEFPEGIIGQWYPAAVEMFPMPGQFVPQIGGGSMKWHVEVDPSLDPAAVPPVSADSVWAPSRNVGATPLRHGAETEKFIFYRGVGRFEMPVRTKVSAGGTVTISNESQDAVPAVFVLNVEGEKGRIEALGPLAAQGSLVTTIPAADLSKADYVAEAKALLTEGLVASGLHDDESWAMVDTWERSWFETEGLRVLYLVPTPWTESLLPMTITPIPDELVRTLVGRIEALTPAEEAEALDLVSAGLGWKAQFELGRFAEPKVRHACSKLMAEDPLSWTGVCYGLVLSLSQLP